MLVVKFSFAGSVLVVGAMAKSASIVGGVGVAACAFGVLAGPVGMLPNRKRLPVMSPESTMMAPAMVSTWPQLKLLSRFTGFLCSFDLVGREYVFMFLSWLICAPCLRIWSEQM